MKAAKIQFVDHHGVPGSGWLPEYLDHIPALAVDLNKAEELRKNDD